MDRPTNRRHDTIRPPTWAQIEAALYNGRMRAWADAIPGFHSMTAGEQTCLALTEFFPQYLPNNAVADALDGLVPGAIDSLVVHLLEHLRLRQPLKRPCAICKPLEGLKVGPDGVGTIRVWRTNINADVRIAPHDRAIAWHRATFSKPAALEKLKQIIKAGDHGSGSLRARSNSSPANST